ncbi:Protein-lysine N-methyltransferase efm5 [Savitreella phatthalungensis]
MAEDLDDLSLSASTLAALQQFREESASEAERFARLQARAEARFDGNPDTESGASLDISDFKEDWQLSQFWYSPETQDALARELLSQDAPVSDNASHSPLRVGVLCAPSVYPRLLANGGQDVWVFEHDPRFRVMGRDKFVQYDYKRPLDVPRELAGTFDRLLVDPPFLSDECQVKAATTARFLLKKGDKGQRGGRAIICSGAKVRELLLKLYAAKETVFEVRHNRDQLSNDFVCLTTYDSTSPAFAPRPL